MAINAELQKWLAEKVQTAMSPEEAQTFTSILSKEAVAEQLNRAWMAPPDYNRKMDELKQKEATLNAELQNHIASLQQWKATEQTNVNQQVAQLQAQYERDVATLRSQIEAEGMQPSVAQPVKPNGAAKPANSNGNSEYLTKAEASAILREELTKAALLQGMTTDLVERHRGLFGSTPDMRKVTDIAVRTGRGIEDVWRETYKVGDREVQLQKEAEDKRVEEAVNARILKMQADGAMSAQNFSGRPEQPSVIRQMLMRKQEENANSPLAVPQPTQQISAGVQAAVEAYNSQKFKQPGQ